MTGGRQLFSLVMAMQISIDAEEDVVGRGNSEKKIIKSTSSD